MGILSARSLVPLSSAQAPATEFDVAVSTRAWRAARRRIEQRCVINRLKSQCGEAFVAHCQERILALSAQRTKCGLGGTRGSEGR
jgi:hypothetical protein